MSAITAKAFEKRVNKHFGGSLKIPNNCLWDVAIGVKTFTSPDVQQMLISITARVSSHGFRDCFLLKNNLENSGSSENAFSNVGKAVISKNNKSRVGLPGTYIQLSRGHSAR